jgi:hypothetical protein
VDGIDPAKEPDRTFTHGTLYGYAKKKCRCKFCHIAGMEYARQRRKRLKAITLPEDDPRHGKPSTYTTHGCRCEKCTKAKSVERAEDFAAQKERRKDD